MLSLSRSSSIISLSGTEDTDKESVYSDSDNEGKEEKINVEESELQDEPLYEGSSHTVLSAYVSIMLFVMKHCLTKEAFTDLLFLLVSFMPKSGKLTTSVYKLKEYFEEKNGCKRAHQAFYM